jgi:hypothetical protein
VVATTTFGVQTIRDAEPYWLQQVAYTALISSVPANAQVSVQTAVQRWNPTNDPKTVVILDAVAASTAPGVQWWIQNDKALGRVDLGTVPPDLTPLPTGRVAVDSLSHYLVNTTSAPAANIQLLYRYTIWHDTLAWRVMRGLPLTDEQRQTLRSLGLETTPTDQRGTLPMTLDRIIEGTYRPRLIRAPLNYALLVNASTTDTTFHTERAEPNQLLVLRSIAAAANEEDGVTITVDRDSQQGAMVLDAAMLRIDAPLTVFLPATQHLSFHVQATTTPAAPIPVRLEIWAVALSNILRLRLGQVTAETLAPLMGAEQAQKLAAAVQAGLV